ncbi:MAG: hypothetical protein O7G30_06100, partial [Proteobacteria bacterium]|nr:hypothetical protein [Pseudomonadota bacterium]
VATGDSGGALFAPDGSGGWELAGTLYARSLFAGQAINDALYGNETLAADIATYRDDIIPLIRPECSDEVDNDLDTDTDLDDDGCENLEDLTEDYDCQDGIDNDDDGLIDLADFGCDSATDGSEKTPSHVCDNGIDDDLDGGTDCPWDVGCGTQTWPTESPQCSDGIDNDGDLEIDWDGGAYFNGGVPIAAVDVECTDQPFRNNEKPDSTGGGNKAGCGTGGPLLLALLPGLFALRRRTRA